MSAINEPLKSEAEAVIDIALTAADPTELDPEAIYSIVVPEGAGHEVLDLEHHLLRPRRAHGTYSPNTLQSFIDYASWHHDPEHTTVWIDQINHQLLAILNDNAPTETSWGDHRVRLQLLLTPEWKHWTAQDGRYLSQEQFAEHIQDGLLEIRDPDAATMLEIAQSIQGKVKADWKSAKRLNTGEVGFTYQEEVTAGAGRSGELQIPEMLQLAIAPFYGEQPFELGARLRYKIREGNLSIGYKLDRPNEVLLTVLGQMASRLREQEGFERVFMGSPA